MGDALNQIHEPCVRLRQAHQALLAPKGQTEIVAVISEWAGRWRDHGPPWRREAEALTEPFPFAMTRVSLEALLESLTDESLWALIDSEHVRDQRGAPLIGHVIAGNTPLLAWTSVLRALLMRSASFVKLPSGGAGDWARLFLRSLAEVSPTLAACVHLAYWPGGTSELDTALCRDVDLLVSYGSNDTIAALQSQCPPAVGLLGYGHRVSFGVVPAGASFDEAAAGFARDVLLYDQGGCLSPHTIFVEGDTAASAGFAACLADALREKTSYYPLPSRSPHAAARVQEARTLARMQIGIRVWEDPQLRWTVIAREARSFVLSPTHGVVSVQPLASVDDLRRAVGPVAPYLQGCAVAAGPDSGGEASWRSAVENLGVSWTCRPGQLQAPPFAWREDDRDVLRSLLPTS